MNKRTMERVLPFSLTAFVILLDQLTKSFIASRWPVGSMIADVFGNDLLRIYHQRNKVVAFSLGEGLPESVRPFLFVLLPIAVLGFLCFFYWKSSEFTRTQRWAMCGIIGGGIGNILDRVLRPDGVVDFISVKFFGLLGFERWPTFNVADSAVVVCVVLWLVTMFLSPPVSGKESAP